jgi:hypothetical protein
MRAPAASAVNPVFPPGSHSPPPSVPGGLPDTSDRVGAAVGVSGHRGGRSGVVCSWVKASDDFSAQPGPAPVEPWEVFERDRDGTHEVRYLRTCGEMTTSVWVAETSKEDLVAAASATVVKFVPHLQPVFAPPKPFVQSSTWFYVDKARWTPVTATAEVDERWVTATATPVTLTLFAEDGPTFPAPATCAGPGMVPDKHLDLFSAPPSPCSFAWHKASGLDPDGVTRVRLQVQWDVTWAGWDGTAGSSPPLRVSTDTAVSVGEIQVLITH